MGGPVHPTLIVPPQMPTHSLAVSISKESTNPQLKP